MNIFPAEKWKILRNFPVEIPQKTVYTKKNTLDFFKKCALRVENKNFCQIRHVVENSEKLVFFV